MNLKRATFVTLIALVLSLVSVGLQAETVKPAPRVSVRVFSQGELNALFQTICSANPSRGNSQASSGLAQITSSLEAECTTACCAHCTRCAETGEIGHCSYCDDHCATEAE